MAHKILPLSTDDNINSHGLPEAWLLKKKQVQDNILHDSKSA